MVIFFLFSYQGSILIGIKKYVIRNEMFKYSALVSGIYIYIYNGPKRRTKSRGSKLMEIRNH